MEGRFMEITEGFLVNGAGLQIAYKTWGCPSDEDIKPGWLFLGGYQSDMTGTKASFLWRLAQKTSTPCTVFDYSGCGRSTGAFEAGTIGGWKDEALLVLDTLTQGPQILIGSSMGGWLMLLLGLERPSRIQKMIGIAAAPDFTEHLCPWLSGPEKARFEAEGEGIAFRKEGPFVVRRPFVEEAKRHLVSDRSLTYSCPVTLLHGDDDQVVSWHGSERLLETIDAPSVQLIRIKNGDHRLHSNADLDLLGRLIRV